MVQQMSSEVSQYELPDTAPSGHQKDPNFTSSTFNPPRASVSAMLSIDFKPLFNSLLTTAHLWIEYAQSRIKEHNEELEDIK